MTHHNNTHVRFILARCRQCQQYAEAMGYGACKRIRGTRGQVDWQEFARRVDDGGLNDCDGYEPRESAT